MCRKECFLGPGCQATPLPLPCPHRRARRSAVAWTVLDARPQRQLQKLQRQAPARCLSPAADITLGLVGEIYPRGIHVQLHKNQRLPRLTLLDNESSAITRTLILRSTLLHWLPRKEAMVQIRTQNMDGQLSVACALATKAPRAPKGSRNSWVCGPCGRSIRKSKKR